MLPYLELAELLASRGHRVSFVSTPGNVARLPPPCPTAAPRVDFVSLPLPRVEDLPDGAESTNTVPHDKFDHFLQAFDGLAAPFAEFLAAACADERRRPDWVIVDCLQHWAAAAALEHKVPSAMLLPSAVYLATSQKLHDESKRNPHIDHGAGMSIARRFFLTLDRCALAVIRSCVEWEPEFLPQVPPLLRKPVLPLGLLPPPSPDGNGVDDDAAVRWLDAQPASSVLYVALGSEVPLLVEQVHELAHGLELVGTRFLWALRKPAGAGAADDAGILLPGFQERTKGKGLVAMGWVPQISILQHGAVGGFLTHCGQRSLTEGLLFGLPLVMLPIRGDQGPNARLMEGKKVGLQVARDEKDGSFDRHGIASAVRAVMVEEETTRVFVANARKAQEIVADEELQDMYIDQLVQQLRLYGADGRSATTTVAPPSAVAGTM